MSAYYLRFDSIAELHASLNNADPSLAYSIDDELRFDESRVILPWPEMTKDEKPQPTGFWLANVYIVGDSEELETIALAPEPVTPDRMGQK